MNVDTHRVLIVAHYFPPDGGAGTQRAAGFARYLGDFGWDCTVLTRQPPDRRGRWDPSDTSLALQETTRLRIKRISPAIAIGKSAFCDLPLEFVDEYTRAAQEEVSNHDIVLVTMSPFGLARVGNFLARRALVPVVFDLRDPWALDGWRSYQSWIHWRADFQLMRSSLRCAQAIIANTAESRLAILKRIPELDPAKVVVIPNGYDDDAICARDFSRSGGDGFFYIVHLGTFHGDWLRTSKRSPLEVIRRMISYRPEQINGSGRTPRYLVKAVEDLHASGNPLAAKIRLVFAGVSDPHVMRCAAESSIARQIEVLDYLPHSEAMSWLGRADALFLPLGCMPNGRRSLIVPGKFYEYLASGKPIIAAVPDGDVATMLRRYDAGVVVDPCDSAQIQSAIVDLASGYRHPRSLAGLEAFHRRKLTGDLAGLLTRLVLRKP